MTEQKTAWLVLNTCWWEVISEEPVLQRNGRQVVVGGYERMEFEVDGGATDAGYDQVTGLAFSSKQRAEYHLYCHRSVRWNQMPVSYEEWLAAG